MLLDLLLFEEVSGESSTDEDMDSFLRLETRCHLLVGYFLGNGGRRCICIFKEELFCCFNGKGCGLNQVGRDKRKLDYRNK